MITSFSGLVRRSLGTAPASTSLLRYDWLLLGLVHERNKADRSLAATMNSKAPRAPSQELPSCVLINVSSLPIIIVLLEILSYGRNQRDCLVVSAR